MRAIFFTITLLCGLATGPAQALEARATCPKSDAADFFFQAGFFYDHPDDDAFQRDWYSQHLAAMKAPSLSCGKPAAAETYRFLWLRTFDRPASVKITMNGADARIETIILSGAGGYEPGSIARRLERRLSAEERRRFAATIASTTYWTLPKNVKDFGFDGAQWIIEARRGDDYHFVERWSPENGPVRELGLLFIELGGLLRVFGNRVY